MCCSKISPLFADLIVHLHNNTKPKPTEQTKIYRNNILIKEYKLFSGGIHTQPQIWNLSYHSFTLTLIIPLLASLKEKLQTTMLEALDVGYIPQPRSFLERNKVELLSWLSVFTFVEKGHLFSLFLALVVTVMSSMSHPAATILCGNVFGTLSTYSLGIIESSKMLEEISRWCILLAILGAFSWIIESSFMFVWMKFGEQQAKAARIKLFVALLSKDIDWHNNREDGPRSFLARVETQIRELQLSVSQPMGFIVYEIFGAFCSLGVALYFSWQLSLLILVNFPFIAAALYAFSRKLGPAVERQNLHLTEASKHASTSFQAINTVTLFNGQKYQLRQYFECLKLVTKSFLIQAKINALQAAVSKFIIVFIYLEGFWFGLQLVSNGSSPSNVVIAFYTTLSITQALEILLSQWMVILKGISASNSLESISSKIWDDWTKKKRGKVSTELNAGDIEFKEVSFSYPANPHNQALQCVNMYFPAGETTYITGKSGSGKSTIGNIIMNYYKPTEGEVLVDEKPIQKFCPDWLRKNIAIMDQETLLFNETILQNIAFGSSSHVSREDIIEAGKTTDLQSMISRLPNGLETRVSLGGKSLSGGQRQRVGIARTRLRDSPILILDEPVSALDLRSREKVMNEIRKWRKGKTTIIITHDVSQIFDDEYVYVMADASVVEEGFRRNLCKIKDGIFLSLVRNACGKSKWSALEMEDNLSKPLTYLGFDCHTGEISDGENCPGSNKERLQKFQANADFSNVIKVQQNEDISSNFSSDHCGCKSTPECSLASSKKLQTNSSVEDHHSPIESRKSHSGSLKLMSELKYDTWDTKSNTTFEEAFKDLSKNKANLENRKEKNLSPCSLPTILSTIWPRLSYKSRTGLIFGLLACLSSAIATPVFAYFISNLMQVYSSPRTQFEEGSVWATSLLVLACFDAVSTYCSHYYLEQAGQEWITALRIECFNNVLKQPKSWMDNEINSPSKLVECLDRSAEETRNLVSRFLAPILSTFMMLTISIVWSLMINCKLTLAALSCGPLVYFSSLAFNHATTKYEDECNKFAENTNSVLTETVANIRVVRLFGLEPYFERKFRAVVASAYSAGLRRSLFSGVTYGITGDTISFITTALVIYYGATLITYKTISPLDYLQIINILLFALGNFFSVISLFPQINASRTTATKIMYLANLSQRNNTHARGSQTLSSLFPIVLDNLNFTYPNYSKPTLKNITFTIPPNSCTAIIGSSGSGKSTIASLLLGLYLPDESLFSSITFAGIPLSRCNPASLRDQIAIVPQDIILFPDTIYANIVYGLPTTSAYTQLDRVIEAANQAGIAEFIDGLDRGYNTVIGEGGVGLSGGQIQRLAIARALVRCPALLILDEATSALDAETTASICHTIQKLRGHPVTKMAIILITHSTQLMAISDSIVVLEEGKIIQRGSFRTISDRSFNR